MGASIYPQLYPQYCFGGTCSKAQRTYERYIKTSRILMDTSLQRHSKVKVTRNSDNMEEVKTASWSSVTTSLAKAVPRQHAQSPLQRCGKVSTSPQTHAKLNGHARPMAKKTLIFITPKLLSNASTSCTQHGGIKVSLKGTTIARKATLASQLYETGLPLFFTICPLTAVDSFILRPSKTTTQYPYKGEASTMM